MFNGCMRVVDKEFQPTYRMPARNGAEPGWRLAVVQEAKDGRPVWVRPCEPETLWVHARSLKAHWPWPGLPKTGDVVRVVGDVEEGPLQRLHQHVDRVEAVSERALCRHQRPDLEPGDQVFLVTDTTARPGRRDPAKDGCYWALGSIADEDPIEVSETARQRFASACRGANDRRVLEGPEGEKDRPTAPVRGVRRGRRCGHVARTAVIRGRRMDSPQQHPHGAGSPADTGHRLPVPR